MIALTRLAGMLCLGIWLYAVITGVPSAAWGAWACALFVRADFDEHKAEAR